MKSIPNTKVTRSSARLKKNHQKHEIKDQEIKKEQTGDVESKDPSITDSIVKKKEKKRDRKKEDPLTSQNDELIEDAIVDIKEESIDSEEEREDEVGVSGLSSEKRKTKKKDLEEPISNIKDEVEENQVKTNDSKLKKKEKKYKTKIEVQIHAENDEAMGDDNEIDYPSENETDLIKSEIETGDGILEREEERSGKEDEMDSDDEAPVGISLRDSKIKAQQIQLQIAEANKLIKSHKKQVIKERQLKNRKQQENKKKSLVPDKLDVELLKLAYTNEEDVTEDSVSAILEKVNQEKRIYKSQPENQKISFNDDIDEGLDTDDGFGDFGEDDQMETEFPRIKAQYLHSVDKIKDIGASARDFLQEHFFGKRIRREKSIKSKFTCSSAKYKRKMNRAKPF